MSLPAMLTNRNKNCGMIKPIPRQLFLLVGLSILLFPSYGQSALPDASPTISEITSYQSSTCMQKGVSELDVEVDTSKIIRSSAPKELFGFNLPWRDFQRGYVRNGSVRPELISLLIPFKGASYRYPGGSPSNWFEWQKTIGPVGKRPRLHADFDRYAIPEFGLNEFANFVTEVNGRALLTLNLIGPYQKTMSPIDIAKDAADMMTYVQDKTSFGCAGGAGCRVMAWELGNEVDWSPFNWSARTYIERADAVISAASNPIPEVQWVANGRTSPWDKKARNYQKYNSELSSAFGPRVQSIAIHPYYDGISIPTAVKYVNNYGKTWAKDRKNASIFVTEHARWPSLPATGPWKANWYQATGLGGAIASTDFLLAIMSNPQVASANWHALGVEGPWQLVKWNKQDDLIYPSPVYWGLRVLREAYLDNVVATQYKQPSIISYSGGYDLRMVGMTSKDGKYASLLGINRSSQAYIVRLHWKGELRKGGKGVIRIVSGASLAEDNTNAEPHNILMQSNSSTLQPARSSSSFCVPPNAIFSVIEP